VLGTAAYLAPEQAAGEQAGPAADLYALGVVAYQFLSGRLPYEAQSLTELALKQQRELPPRLDELNPEVSPQLAMAVDRALALDPRQRPASADELRRLLADGARGVGPDPSTTRVAGPATSATSVVGQQRGATTGVARAPVQQRRPRAPRTPRPVPTSATVAPPAARPRRRGGAKRFFGIVLVLLLLAAGGAAAVIATSKSDQAVKLRRVVYDDVEQGVDAVKQLVNDNTQ
jgi:serine/threonine-protein kinase